MADHDHGYKLLFSHVPVVADLLRGFVKEDWVQELDFDTLERVDGSYVFDDLRHRESDMVWKVRWKDRVLYIYILLEFQSTVDPFMPVRSMTYTGLLLQTLIRQKTLTPAGLLAQVVLPARFPGVQVPEVRNLKEMHSMLEENMRKWARQEKEEAWREGRQEGAHEMLLSQMEARFGLIPEEVRRSVQEIRDTEELKELGKRLLSAASLSDLRLH